MSDVYYNAIKAVSTPEKQNTSSGKIRIAVKKTSYRKKDTIEEVIANPIEENTPCEDVTPCEETAPVQKENTNGILLAKATFGYRKI